MKCDTSRELFCERIDGSLDPDRSAHLDQHLAQCSTCMAEFTTLRLAVEAMRREGRPQTSPDERAAIMAAIDREAEDRLVASAVAGEVIERRSGVFKRAMLMPAPVIAKRPGLALLTHVTSFAVGIAAAALFWFGSRATTTQDRPQSTTTSPPLKASAPEVPPVVAPPVVAPPVVAPKVPANEPPPEMLMRVAGKLKVLHNGRESVQSGAPLTLKPGDTLEAKTAGTWSIVVGKNGDLELSTKQVEPAPAPAVPRGPLFTIDLDPAPLHLLAAGVRSSLDRATNAFERAAVAMPKPEPAATHETATQPEPMPPVTAEPVAAQETSDTTAAPPVASANGPGFTPRPPVVVRTEGDRLRLETSGPPLEVIPALVLRLRDDDPQIVALVIARLELVREEYERDPTFPRVPTKDAPVEKSILRKVTDYVIPAQDAGTVEDAHTYWTRWFDRCADAIVARETFGTW